MESLVPPKKERNHRAHRAMHPRNERMPKVRMLRSWILG